MLETLIVFIPKDGMSQTLLSSDTDIGVSGVMARRSRTTSRLHGSWHSRHCESFLAQWWFPKMRP